MQEVGIYEETGTPFSGRKKERLELFLQQAGLEYDEQIEYTVNLVHEKDGIVATGSIQKNILKCIAVSDAYQGMGLSGTIITNLMNYAVEHGCGHLFLFTKPRNRSMFSDLGFYPIVETKQVLLMENRRDGIRKYVQSLTRPETTEKTVGAVVVNCNPFTNGHRYLLEQACLDCDILHVFLVSEDRSFFSTELRYRLLQEGTADLKKVVLHQTSDYMISHAVFPTYFMKDQKQAKEANCELDIRIFCEHFAGSLGITRRYVGTEPFCEVTDAYNRAMKQILPEYGIRLAEIPRKCCGEVPISASHVRRCLAEGNYEEIRKVVPLSTYHALLEDLK